MQDNAQSFDQVSRSALVVKDDSVSFSFIAAFHSGERILEKSILSIEDLGDELGLNYEIILPVDSESSQKQLMHDLAGKIECVRLWQFNGRNAGLQKRIMQSNSFGSYVVLFNPSTVYDIEYADMLHSFTSRKDEIVLYSDLIVIPAVVFKRVGTWRDLRDAEDLDILVRITGVTGLVVYGRDGKGISFRSNEPVIFRTEKLPRTVRSVYSLLLRQRDQITGSSYRMSDINSFYRLRKNAGLARYLLTFSSYVMSKLGKLKPYDLGGSNYSLLMDRILESLILADFRRYTGFTGTPRLKIEPNDLKYLRESGKVWGKIVENIESYVSEN